MRKSKRDIASYPSISLTTRSSLACNNTRRFLCFRGNGAQKVWVTMRVEQTMSSRLMDYARMYSGVSLDSFLQYITAQSLTEEGLRKLGPYVAKMAEVEGLEAHKRDVTLPGCCPHVKLILITSALLKELKFLNCNVNQLNLLS